jgi:hypothetical protein
MDNLNNPTPSLETEKDREASSEDRLPDVSPEDIANILDRVAQLSAERQKKRQELALQQTPQHKSQRVTISVTNTDEHELIPEVLNIIVKVPSLYQQHGGVILRHRDNGKGKIEVLGEKALRREIVERIEFVREVGPAIVKARMSNDVVNGILHGDRYPGLPEFREFRRLAYAPFFAADGTLVAKSGYHEASRTILSLSPDLEGMQDIAAKPTEKQVEGAARFLTDDLLGDFPFSPLEPSRAHMLAILITPFIRDLIGGLVPQLGIAAPAHGSGKTLLAKVAGLIATGEEQPAMTAITDADEQRKVITAVLLSGQPIAVWDNVKQGDIVGGSPTAAVLSSPVWEGRILGKSEMVRLPNSCLWIVTGNNLQFTGELARRTLVVQLKPKTDSPHLREGDSFRHWPLEDWIKANRIQLIRAILTLVQHWIVSGRVPFEARTMLTFERYAQVVGGILQAAKLEQGFLTPTRDIGGNDESVVSPFGSDEGSKDAMHDDPDAPLRTFVDKWAVSPGYGLHFARELLEYAPKPWHGTILEGEAANKVVQLGKYLQKNSGRVFGDHKIVMEKKKDENSRDRNAFRLVPIRGN